MKNMRKEIVHCLREIEMGNHFPKEVLQGYQERVPKEQWGLFHQIVNGVIENRSLLDGIIGHYSKIKLKKYRVVDLAILRMAVYELLFLHRSKSYAVINEAVKLMKKQNYALSGLVNGILRNIDRNREGVIEEVILKERGLDRQLAMRYAHPLWLVKAIQDVYGEKTSQILAGNQEKPPLSLRVTVAKISREEYGHLLSQLDIGWTVSPYAPEGIFIHELGDHSIRTLPGYEEGLFTVQGEASMMIPHYMNLERGLDVLDMCAAPGGKATHVASLIGPTGQLVACDISEEKLDKIAGLAKRLQLENLKIERRDASKYQEAFKEKFDRVLLDAPCSGIGIIRKKPDIKWNKTMADSHGLSALQRTMLDNAGKYVKIGGEILYSTCTILPQENQEVVQDFLQANDHFQLVPLASSPYIKNGMLQLLPGVHGTDGFFACLLRRTR